MNSGSGIALYIKGGPVRVKGTYAGRWTILTDEFSTYRRHAWYNSSVGGGIPVDTIRTNIWITDDLVNVDAGSFGGPPQPLVMDENNEVICNYDAPGDCGGSNNVLGLVSSSNIIIANTDENRTSGVDIHAHVVGLNESFVMHYYQNSFHQMQ